MARAIHLRHGRITEVFGTPPTPESDACFVSALRKAGENCEKVKSVLEKYRNLTHQAVHDSLLELAIQRDTAPIAFCAGSILEERDILQRAASTIIASSHASEELKDIVRPYVGRGKGTVPRLR